jgi:hypothetical protein
MVRFTVEGPVDPTDVSVRLALLLPNPLGDEGQSEEAILANDGTQAVSLTDWTLRDRTGKSWVLDSLGTRAPDEKKTIRRGGQPMAMNNTGDTVDLLGARRPGGRLGDLGRGGQGGGLSSRIDPPGLRSAARAGECTSCRSRSSREVGAPAITTASPPPRLERTVGQEVEMQALLTCPLDPVTQVESSDG